MIAGLGGWLVSLGYAGPGVLLLAGAAGLVLAGYVAASRTDVDATTEVSAIVVLGAGVAAGIGYLALASSLVAISVLFLVEKTRLHAWVARVQDRDLTAAARFAVMAIVILPLLPEGPYGPWDTVRPRELWILVLFFSGLSFAGYLARRAVGARHGYALAGIFAGLISSTSATLAFARSSTSAPALAAPLAQGAIAASTMLFVRVAIATTVLNPTLAAIVAPYLLLPFLVGLSVMIAGFRSGLVGKTAPEMSNPLELRAALQMAALFQLVLIGVALASRWLGQAGIIASGAVLGLTDVDALTISMSRNTGVPAGLAAQGLATGILANTAFKCVVALTLGSPGFRARAGATLAGMGAGLGTMLWWW
jgi:uncharacterized membrane protein (DUF4010 family)